MAITTTTKRRGGVDYTIEYGLTDDTAPHCVITGGVEQGLTVQRKIIDFNASIWHWTIHTRWKRYLLDGEGNPLPGSYKEEEMYTNLPDKKSFASMLWGLLVQFIINGFVRSILGFNFQPVFAADETEIDDAIYNTDAPQAPFKDGYKYRGSDGVRHDDPSDSADLSPYLAPVTPTA